MLKKIISLTMVFIITLTLCSSTLASTTEPESEKVIKIGYVPEYGVIVNNTLEGKQGYGYDYFEKLSEYTGHTYEYIECHWSNRTEMLESGEIDLFGSVAKTDERATKYLFPNEPFTGENIVLFAPNSSDLMFDDFEGLENKKIGIVTDSAYIPFLESYLEEHSINAEIVFYNDCELDMLNALSSGMFDGVVSGSTSPMEDCKIIANLGFTESYFIALPENQELVDEINYGLYALKQEDFRFASRLYDKHYSSDNFAKASLTKEDQQLLENHGLFTVDFSASHYPYQYLDKDGNAAGIVIDLLDLILKDSNIEIKYIPNYGSCLNASDADINLCIKHKLDNFHSSYIFCNLPLVSITKKDTEIDQISNIAATPYTNIRLIQDDIIYYPDLDHLEKPFLNDEVDQIIVTYAASHYILRNQQVEDFHIEPLLVSLPLTLEISDSIPELVPVLNKLVYNLNENEVNDIVLSHVSEIQSDLSLLDYLKSDPYIIFFLFAALFIFVLITNEIKKRALLKLLNYDLLTGLLSERHFFEKVTTILTNAKPSEYIALSVDIDNFKYINDVYGYERGSLALKAFSKLLKDCFNEDALVARSKGDVFSIFIKNTDENRENISKLSQITSFVQEDSSTRYFIAVSTGMDIVDDPTLSVQHIIDCANTARLKVKPYFESAISEYTTEMKNTRIVNMDITTSMQEALETNQFYIVLQPKYNTRTTQIVGAEALVRWQKEDGSMLYPNQFIPIFENNGFIEKLDFYVFEQVCKFIKQHNTQCEIPKISVNLSCVTLLNEFMEKNITEIQNKYGVLSSQIEFEITESAFVTQFDRVIAKVAYFKQLGFTVSIDDFGSGLSSFNRLRDVSVDVLKIDKGCIDHCDSDKGTVILQSIIEMAKRLELQTIAEGVETAETFELLKSLGCDEIQGYYFSKPIATSAFLSLLKQVKKETPENIIL